MASSMQCDIVSAEKEIFSGRITNLSALGTIGELGILPGHAPLLTGVRPGPIRLTLEGGEEEIFFASGGFLEVQPGVVTVPRNVTSSVRIPVRDPKANEELFFALRDLAQKKAQQRFYQELRKESIEN